MKLTDEGYCPFSAKTLVCAVIAGAAAWGAFGFLPALVLVTVLAFIQSIAEEFYRAM